MGLEILAAGPFRAELVVVTLRGNASAASNVVHHKPNKALLYTC